MTDLLDAVDQLTKPVFVKVIQHFGAEEIPRTTRIEHAPLLDQLEQAIVGAMDTKAGSSASLKFTRGVIDSEALFHFLRIKTMIADWCHMVGVEPTGHPTNDLRAWYAAQLAVQRESDTWHVSKIRSWGAVINERLDPHDVMDLPHPCPVTDCPQDFDSGLGAFVWYDPKTREKYLRPLVVEYRATDEAEMVAKATGRCRACGTTWSVRALAHDLEHAAREATETTPNELE